MKTVCEWWGISFTAESVKEVQLLKKLWNAVKEDKTIEVEFKMTLKDDVCLIFRNGQ